MPTDRLAQLDDRIATLRKRLEAAERMREAVKDDPDLLDLFSDPREAAESPAATSAGGTSSRGRKKRPPREITGGPVAAGYFKRIAEYLEAGGNRAQGIPAIARGTGLKSSAVIQVTYRTHGVLFEQSNIAGHSTKKAWRLKADWRRLLGSDADLIAKPEESPSRDHDGSNEQSFRSRVLAAIAHDWLTVDEIASRVGIHVRQVRGVLGAPGVKDKVARKPGDGEQVYRLAEGGATMEGT